LYIKKVVIMLFLGTTHPLPFQPEMPRTKSSPPAERGAALTYLLRKV
jgi:hypothetical protein